MNVKHRKKKKEKERRSKEAESTNISRKKDPNKVKLIKESLIKV